MLKFVERIYDGLVSNTLPTVGALIIFLLALPLIRSGLREKPPPVAPPAAPTPIQIESPWFVQNFLTLVEDVEKIKRQLELMSSQIAGITSLLKRRQNRKPKK